MANDQVTILIPKRQDKYRPAVMCASVGCKNWAWVRGYCNNHYAKLKKLGIFKNVRTPKGDLRAKFYANIEVNPDTLCWEWIGYFNGGNRKCSNPAHLYAGTGKDNAMDCVERKRHPALLGMLKRKITPQMAMNIRILYARGQHSYNVLAEIYGVSLQTIGGIINGQAHLDMADYG